MHVTRGGHPGRRRDEASLSAGLRRERVPDGGLPPVTPSDGKREKYPQVHLSVQSRYVQGRIQDFVKEDRNSGWDCKQAICSILVRKNAKNGIIWWTFTHSHWSTARLTNDSNVSFRKCEAPELFYSSSLLKISWMILRAIMSHTISHQYFVSYTKKII